MQIIQIVHNNRKNYIYVYFFLPYYFIYIAKVQWFFSLICYWPNMLSSHNAVSCALGGFKGVSLKILKLPHNEFIKLLIIFLKNLWNADAPQYFQHISWFFTFHLFWGHPKTERIFYCMISSKLRHVRWWK